MPNTVVLARSLVSKALADPAFFEAVPEFKSLQAKLKTMQVAFPRKSGCGSCAQRRIEQNLFGDFLLVLRSLGPDAAARFKKYANIDVLMYSVQNPQTMAFETKTM